MFKFEAVIEGVETNMSHIGIISYATIKPIVGNTLVDSVKIVCDREIIDMFMRGERYVEIEVSVKAKK